MMPMTPGERTLLTQAAGATLTGRCSRERVTGHGRNVTALTTHALPYRWYTPSRIRAQTIAGGDAAISVDELAFLPDADIQPDDRLTDETDATLRWRVTGVAQATDPAVRVVHATRQSDEG